MKQNYSNHKKYYAPHHFIFLPAMSICIGYGVYQSFTDEPNSLGWMLFAILSAAILYLAIMVRQHYALGNQDRIVRLEFRLRYYQLYHQSSDVVEKQLSFNQIAALRFADDEEFKRLLNKTLDQRLSSSQIKRNISSWQADNMRV